MYNILIELINAAARLGEGRYKSCPTQAETYLFTCQRYIELNPVRANLRKHPAEYQWSSYQANAQGAKFAYHTARCL